VSAATKEHPVDGAFRYARGVIRGDIVAPVYVKMACKRFISDVKEALAGRGEWEFRPDLAARPLIFAGLMKNIKGPMAGKPLQLGDWQVFILVNLFGFVERGTTARRFRQGIVYVPRGNGKTTFAAPIALYLTFIDGEGGAEGYAAAVTRDQARILFDTAQAMVRKSPELKSNYGIEVNANSILQADSASKFVPVSSDAKALDGLNVQVAICDEIGSHKTSEVYDVLLTAMGKRKHPMLLSISTATGNNTGIGKTLWDYGVRVLEGKNEDERVFVLIYSADAGDDPWDEKTWMKANPSWGSAVQPDAIRAIMKQARNNPAQEAAAKTRHLNIWVGADEALFSSRAWADCKRKLSLDAFVGMDCHVGLDLATRTDLAGMSLVFPQRDKETGKMRYTVFARAYINQEAVLEARNPSYPGWAASGDMIITPGNETDFDFIESDLRDLAGKFRIQSVRYDPWQATQLSQRLRAEGLNCVEFRATTQNFSPAIIELDAAMRGGRLDHDGNPVLEWCMGNVVGTQDRRGNFYPTKSKPEQKIDLAVAAMMGIAGAMDEDGDGESIYETRGVLMA